MGGDPGVAGERIDNYGDDSVLDNVSFSISSQDLPLGVPPAPHAESFWLHFRHNLVGDCAQHDSLFCSITREFIFYTAFNLRFSSKE